MSLSEHSPSYASRRAELTTYFDRTAAETWKRLTSDAPVSRIRATVRAGRAEMADTLAGWLAEDLTGARILDAGCGTGTLAMRLAARGAEVVAVDVAANLVEVAAERAAETLTPAAAKRIRWHAGDMLASSLGQFDFIIAMDSLIHYRQHDMVDAVTRLAERAEGGLLFTYAPRTPLLAAMHVAGSVFPKSDRSPRIEPIPRARIAGRLGQRGLRPCRLHRVHRGFYISEALEVTAQ
ncbi:MAG: magnesium protoporphyrin IX methyltransferase [Pseudomonadota bacterium]